MSILNSASSKSVYRGYEYYKNSNVISCIQISDYEYEGYVKGTNKEPYHVIINTKHPRKSSCDCPFANGNTTCKHMVSLFFTVSPEDLRDYEDWYESDYDDEYEEDDYYENYTNYEYDYYDDYDYKENYNRKKTKFIKPIFFDGMIKSFVDKLSEQELRRILIEELNKDEEHTFISYLKDEYNKYINDKNSIYGILEALNKKLYKMAHNYDYNYNNYEELFLPKKEQDIIVMEYKRNENVKEVIDNMFLNPELSAYDDYKWFAMLYKTENNEIKINRYIQKLESFFDTLKHYSIKNTIPKSNVLIMIDILKEYNIEERAENLVKNCRYPEYVDYIINNEEDIKKLYKCFKNCVEEKRFLNYECIAKVFYKFYEITGDDEIYDENIYYSFLSNKDISYLKCLKFSSKFDYYIDRLLNTTKDVIILEKIYIVLDKKDELFKLLFNKQNEHRLIANIEFLKDEYTEELLKYFKNNFYEIISREKNRQAYHKACYYVSAISRLNNGKELVDNLISELRNSEYSKRSALFDEIYKVMNE